MKFVVTVFPLVRDLFFRDFAPKITFFDNRIVPLDRVNKKKIFSTSRLSLSGEFKKFAAGDSAKRAVGRLSGNSFWALVLHILSNNNFDGKNRRVDTDPSAKVKTGASLLGKFSFSKGARRSVSLTKHQKLLTYNDGFLRFYARAILNFYRKDLARQLRSSEIGRAVQQECRDRSRMPSSA
eukprot:TRINITY_DN6293_c0_g1_i3.p1 TRINITY_DN6293_c0_g1~~TRINITY_DN6293_c0_g1_i3.p1  ORF type:complete len:181 (+),score=1.89 TRINITY_DN6293_c0_g1_i3:187-729(+)